MKLFLITIVSMLSQWVLVGPAAEITHIAIDRYEVPNEFIEKGLDAIITAAELINPKLKQMRDQKRFVIQVVP